MLNMTDTVTVSSNLQQYTLTVWLGSGKKTKQTLFWFLFSICPSVSIQKKSGNAERKFMKLDVCGLC
jgi:hypothetical protein